MRRMLWLLVLLPVGCDGSDADPLGSTWHCTWPTTRACEEYIPVAVPGTGVAHVNFEEAERSCEDPGNPYAPGDYGEGACPHAEALGRCVLPAIYLARRYYYTGFAGVAADDQSANDLIASSCRAITNGAVYERPPFAD